MKKTLDFKVEGDIKIQIGDESYYDEKGISTVPQYTLEKVYEDVEGEVKFSLTDDTPYAEILLRIKGLPGNRKLIALTDDGQVRYNGAHIKASTKELGCDTASYLFNGYEVYTGSDGMYGRVIEFTIDSLFAGVYIDICGPIMIGGTMEELHAIVSEALKEWIVEEK